MGALRVIGGIIAIVGGALIMIHVILATGMLSVSTNYAIGWVLNLVVALLAILGGLLGIASKLRGSPALIAGLLALLLPIIGSVSGNMGIAQVCTQLSGIYYYTGLAITILPSATGGLLLSIESVIILVGGIIMLVSPSD